VDMSISALRAPLSSVPFAILYRVRVSQSRAWRLRSFPFPTSKTSLLRPLSASISTWSYPLTIARRFSVEPSNVKPSSSPPPPSAASPPGKEGEKPLGFFRRFWRDYGLLGAGIYFSIWAVGIPLWYIVIQTGILPIDGQHVISFLQWIHLDQVFHIDITDFEKYGDWALAFALNKICEIIRIPLALGVTVWVRRVLNARQLPVVGASGSGASKSTSSTVRSGLPSAKSPSLAADSKNSKPDL